MEIWVDNTKRFFYILLFFVFILTYMLVKPYLSTIILAFITVVLFQPVYNFWHKAFKKRDGIATPVTILSVFVAGLLPFSAFLVITVNQARTFYKDALSSFEGRNVTLEQVIDESNRILDKLPIVDYEINSENLKENITKVIEPAGNFLIVKTPKLLSISSGLITQLIIYISVLAALFPTKDRLLEYIKEASPLKDNVDEVYLNRMIAMIKSMVKGSFLIAIVQSLTALFFFWLAGMNYLAFWLILMIFFGIVLLGVAFITYPVSLFMILGGNFSDGVLLFIVTTLIINNIDNVLRPKLVSSEAQLHPTLVIISVLGGLKLFGPMGFIYGPVMMIFFVTTFETYMKYYRIK